MLLKHSLLALTIFSLITTSLCQLFNSGLLELTSMSSAPTYTITLNNKLNDIIISISAFTSKPQTNCSISSRLDYQANVSCTDNVFRVSYLFYEKSPLMYSSVFSYYFLEGNTANKEEHALWTANKSWSIAERPRMRAVLSGFVAEDDLVTLIELKGLEDGWTLNITRSLNVKIITFSFILIQNYSPYNLTFVESQIFKTSELKLSGIRTDYLDFWGISSLKNSRRSVSTPFTINLTTSFITELGSAFLSIDSFSISDNTVIGSLFMYSDTPTLNCSSSYFDISTQSCIDYCPTHIYTWMMSQLEYKACLSQKKNVEELQIYQVNNLGLLLSYVSPGCLEVGIEDSVKVFCKKCKEGFMMYGEDCVCNLGSYYSQNECHQCEEGLCSLSFSKSAELIKIEDHFNLTIWITLPKNETYLNHSDPSFNSSVQVNKHSEDVLSIYNQTTKVMKIQMHSLKQSQNYEVSINFHSQSELFFIQRNTLTFLWNLSTQVFVSTPLEPEEQVIKSIAPIFEDSDKSVPLILMIAFFLGNKINTFSLFQTVSLIYLVNFLSIGQQYNSLRDIITDIFIFQPKPILKIFGSQNSWIKFPKIDLEAEDSNPRVQQYTNNEMFLTLALNSFCSITLQIGVIIGLIKIIKQCSKQSPNQIIPQGKYAVFKNIDLSRSEIKEKGTIKWKNEIQVRSQASFRYKMYIYFCVIDQKKWIVISSIWSMYVLSWSFLLFYQLTLPLNSLWNFISSIACYAFLTLILSYPFLLLRYEPLYTHKCLSLCYKRKPYKNWQIWLYFYFTYTESIIYALIVVSLSEATYQLVSILGVLLVKFLLLRSKLKKIELLRFGTIFGFFLILLISHLLEQGQVGIMGEITTGSLLSIIFIELLKIIRGIIITVLNFFKEKKEEPQLQPKKTRETIEVEVIKPTMIREKNSPTRKVPNSENQQYQNQFLEASYHTMKKNDNSEVVSKPKAFRRRLLHLRS